MLISICLLVGETTVSNEVLDTVLKAGEVLKIRGLWRQTEDGSSDVGDKAATSQTLPAAASLNKQVLTKKPEDMQPKIAVKKDDKLLKAFNQVTPQGVSRYLNYDYFLYHYCYKF